MLIFQEADVTNVVVCLLRALRTVQFFQIASSSLGKKTLRTSSSNVTSCSFASQRSNAAIDAHWRHISKTFARLLTTPPLPLQSTAAVTTYCSIYCFRHVAETIAVDTRYSSNTIFDSTRTRTLHPPTSEHEP